MYNWVKKHIYPSTESADRDSNLSNDSTEQNSEVSDEEVLNSSLGPNTTTQETENMTEPEETKHTAEKMKAADEETHKAASHQPENMDNASNSDLQMPGSDTGSDEGDKYQESDPSNDSTEQNSEVSDEEVLNSSLGPNKTTQDKNITEPEETKHTAGKMEAADEETHRDASHQPENMDNAPYTDLQMSGSDSGEGDESLQNNISPTTQQNSNASMFNLEEEEDKDDVDGTEFQDASSSTFETEEIITQEQASVNQQDFHEQSKDEVNVVQTTERKTSDSELGHKIIPMLQNEPEQGKYRKGQELEQMMVELSLKQHIPDKENEYAEDKQVKEMEVVWEPTDRARRGEKVKDELKEYDLSHPTSPSTPSSATPIITVTSVSPATRSSTMSNTGTPIITVSSISPGTLPPACLYNQTGKVCNVLGERCILTEVNAAPVFVGTRMEECEWGPVGVGLVWCSGRPLTLDQVPDGAEVCFDAVILPGTSKFVALVVWQDTKPTISTEPYFNSYVIVEEFNDIKVNFVSFEDDHGLVKATIQDKEQLVEFSNSVVFKNGQKVESKEEIDDLCGSGCGELFANVYMLVTVDGDDQTSYQYGFMCSCLWSEMKPQNTGITSRFDQFTLYQKVGSYYSDGEEQLYMHCDAQSELVLSDSGCKLTYKNNNQEIIDIMCTEESFYCDNQRVSPVRGGQVKVHLRRTKNTNGIIVWTPVMVQLPHNLMNTDTANAENLQCTEHVNHSVKSQSGSSSAGTVNKSKKPEAASGSPVKTDKNAKVKKTTNVVTTKSNTPSQGSASAKTSVKKTSKVFKGVHGTLYWDQYSRLFVIATKLKSLPSALVLGKRALIVENGSVYEVFDKSLQISVRFDVHVESKTKLHIVAVWKGTKPEESFNKSKTSKYYYDVAGVYRGLSNSLMMFDIVLDGQIKSITTQYTKAVYSEDGQHCDTLPISSHVVLHLKESCNTSKPSWLATLVIMGTYKRESAGGNATDKVVHSDYSDKPKSKVIKNCRGTLYWRYELNMFMIATKEQKLPPNIAVGERALFLDGGKVIEARKNQRVSILFDGHYAWKNKLHIVAMWKGVKPLISYNDSRKKKFYYDFPGVYRGVRQKNLLMFDIILDDRMRSITTEYIDALYTADGQRCDSIPVSSRVSLHLKETFNNQGGSLWEAVLVVIKDKEAATDSSAVSPVFEQRTEMDGHRRHYTREKTAIRSQAERFPQAMSTRPVGDTDLMDYDDGLCYSESGDSYNQQSFSNRGPTQPYDTSMRENLLQETPKVLKNYNGTLYWHSFFKEFMITTKLDGVTSELTVGGRPIVLVDGQVYVPERGGKKLPVLFDAYFETRTKLHMVVMWQGTKPLESYSESKDCKYYFDARGVYRGMRNGQMIFDVILDDIISITTPHTKAVYTTEGQRCESIPVSSQVSLYLKQTSGYAPWSVTLVVVYMQRGSSESNVMSGGISRDPYLTTSSMVSSSVKVGKVNTSERAFSNLQATAADSFGTPVQTSEVIKNCYGTLFWDWNLKSFMIATEIQGVSFDINVGRGALYIIKGQTIDTSRDRDISIQFDAHLKDNKWEVLSIWKGPKPHEACNKPKSWKYYYDVPGIYRGRGTKNLLTFDVILDGRIRSIETEHTMAVYTADGQRRESVPVSSPVVLHLKEACNVHGNPPWIANLVVIEDQRGGATAPHTVPSTLPHNRMTRKDVSGANLKTTPVTRTVTRDQANVSDSNDQRKSRVFRKSNIPEINGQEDIKEEKPNPYLILEGKLDISYKKYTFTYKHKGRKRTISLPDDIAMDKSMSPSTQILSFYLLALQNPYVHPVCGWFERRTRNLCVEDTMAIHHHSPQDKLLSLRNQSGVLTHYLFDNSRLIMGKTRHFVEGNEERLVHAVVEEVTPRLIGDQEVNKEVIFLTSNSLVCQTSIKFLAHAQADNDNPTSDVKSQQQGSAIFAAENRTMKQDAQETECLAGDQSSNPPNKASGSIISEGMWLNPPLLKKYLARDSLDELSTKHDKWHPVLLGQIEDITGGTAWFHCSQLPHPIHLPSGLPRFGWRKSGKTNSAFLLTSRKIDEGEVTYQPLYLWPEGAECNPYIVRGKWSNFMDPENRLLNLQVGSKGKCYKYSYDAAFTRTGSCRKSVSDFLFALKTPMFAIVEDIVPVYVNGVLVIGEILFLTSSLIMALAGISTLVGNYTQDPLQEFMSEINPAQEMTDSTSVRKVTDSNTVKKASNNNSVKPERPSQSVSTNIKDKVPMFCQAYKDMQTQVVDCTEGLTFHVMPNLFTSEFKLRCPRQFGFLSHSSGEYGMIEWRSENTAAMCHISDFYYKGTKPTSWKVVEKKHRMNVYAILLPLERVFVSNDCTVVNALAVLGWISGGPKLVSVHNCESHHSVVTEYKQTAPSSTTSSVTDTVMATSNTTDAVISIIATPDNRNALGSCHQGNTIFSVHPDMIQSFGFKKMFMMAKYFLDDLVLFINKQDELVWCKLSNIYIHGKKCISKEDLLVQKFYIHVLVEQCPAIVLGGKTVNLKGVVGVYVDEEDVAPGIHICENHCGAFTLATEEHHQAVETFQDMETVWEQRDTCYRYLMDTLLGFTVPQTNVNVRMMRPTHKGKSEASVLGTSHEDRSSKTLKIKESRGEERDQDNEEKAKEEVKAKATSSARTSPSKTKSPKKASLKTERDMPPAPKPAVDSSTGARTKVKEASVERSPTELTHMLKTGKVTDVYEVAGKLQLQDGKDYFFKREKCFLFDVCLRSVEIWHVLSIGLEVECEMVAGERGQDLKSVLVGGSPPQDKDQLYSTINTWCDANLVADTARQILLAESGCVLPAEET